MALGPQFLLRHPLGHPLDFRPRHAPEELGQAGDEAVPDGLSVGEPQFRREHPRQPGQEEGAVSRPASVVLHIPPHPPDRLTMSATYDCRNNDAIYGSGWPLMQPSSSGSLVSRPENCPWYTEPISRIASLFAVRPKTVEERR